VSTVPSAGPRWAVTLFSFTNELLAAERSPDDLLAEVLEADGTTLVEIDAAQHFRSFPLLDLDEVRRAAEVVRGAGARVSLLGGGADLVPGPGIRLDDEAVLVQLKAQVEAARLLGAEGIRLPFGVLPWTVLERAAEPAREAGVLLLEEVQGPADPGGPRVRERIADLERTGEPAVRLLLDLSALMSGLPPTYVDALTADGVPPETIDRLAGEAGALLDGLFGSGFDGAVCTEWGGHEWQGVDVPAAEQVQAHRRLFDARFRTASTDFGTKTT
jgi:hypothetical protein